MTIRARLEAPEFAGEREPVPFTVVIENDADVTADLHLQGREILFDFTVIGEGGRLVWRKVTGQAQAILRLETIRPHGSVRLDGSWDQRDTNGEFAGVGFYTLQAIVPTDAEPLVSQDRLLQILSRPMHGPTLARP